MAFIGFDELCEFTERQFFYMLTRARSTSGIRPYVRATCNPDSESWVARLIDWWIDDDGFPIPERSGVVRWFARLDERLEWFDSKRDAIRACIKSGMSRSEAVDVPKSFTFVPAKLEDNPTLMKNDPGYRANLLIQSKVDRERLLRGNWKVRPESGEMFPRHMWKRTSVLPAGCRLARGWDKAGTEGGTGARSAGVLVGYHPESMRWYIAHGDAERYSDIERDMRIKSIAERDDSLYRQVPIIIEQEGGSGGKQSARISSSSLAGHVVHTMPVSGEKATRWRPFASQVQAGNVWLVDNDTWDVEDFISELDRLAGDKEKDKNLLKDYADAGSIAFNWICDQGLVRIPEELLCSGDPEAPQDERRPLTDEELEELPDYLADIVRGVQAEQRDYGGERPDMYGF